MLTKRTNILFSQDTWDQLVAVAAKRGQSIGQLVRKAVVAKYNLKTRTIDRSPDNPFLALRKIAKKYKTPALTVKEIKEYINAGRRY